MATRPTSDNEDAMTTTTTTGAPAQRPERTVLTSTMQDAQLSIADLVRHGTTAYADTEITDYDGETTRRTNLAALGARAAQLATALCDTLDVQLGEPVASFLWNTLEHFECYLAVPAMGAVLHTLNARYTDEQVAYTSRHAADRVVIVEPSLLDQFLRLLPELPAVEHLVLTGEVTPAFVPPVLPDGVTLHRYEELLAGRSTSYDWPALAETAAALMSYTSGTTGNPKGVVYSHRSVYLVSMQLCMGNYLGLSAADTVLLVVPMFHTNSWSFPYAALMVGASMVLPSRFVQPPHLLRLIEQERPTVSAGVPTIWNDLLQLARTQDVDLSSLRDVVVGGSACPMSLQRAYQDEYGVRLLHGWGMTEMSPVGTIARPDGLDDETAWALRMTQGRFVATVQARVVGPDGAVLPSDGTTVGEIETRGPWVTGSYHLQPDDSRFHDGWLRTGDAGTISPRGVLHLRDRIKDVIKSGGEWISSIALEHVIDGYPDIVDVAVIGVEDERWGERPLAIVTVRSDAHLDLQQLANFVAGQVDRWEIPERWSLVTALPRTSVGKTDKARLRRLYADDELAVQIITVPRS
jgi:fatty-acyl-CoA synthase